MNKAETNQAAASLDVILRHAFLVLLLVIVHLSFTTLLGAQIESAPPPLKMMTKAELKDLEAEKDGKRRTRLVIEMMNRRLNTAEGMAAAKDHGGSFREFGAFHALMDEGLDYLYKINKGKNRTLDNFKRIEIALRGFAMRIETIRASMPPEYDEYVRSLLKNIRDARTRASEPLFGDSVIRDGD